MPVLSKLFLQKTQEKAILNALKTLRVSDKMSDVELQCSGGVISAHKIILATTNQFFEAIFTENNGDAKSDKVQFNYSVEVVKIVVDFLYTGLVPPESEKDLDRIIEILDMAHTLEVSSLFKHYWLSLTSLLSVDNFLLQLKTAERYNEVTVDKFTFMVDHIDDILQEESFCQLSEKHVENLIHAGVDKKIHADIITTWVIKWGEFNPDDRSDEVFKLFDYIGVSKLSSPFLKNLFKNELVINCEQVQQILINEAIQRLPSDSTREMSVQVDFADSTIPIDSNNSAQKIAAPVAQPVAPPLQQPTCFSFYSPNRSVPIVPATVMIEPIRRASSVRGNVMNIPSFSGSSPFRANPGYI